MRNKEHIETFYNINFSYTGNGECDVYIVKCTKKMYSI